MEKLSLIILIGGLLSIQSICAQTSSTIDTEVRKNSISFNALGTASYLGISYERLIAQRISLEFGIGMIGYGIGATVYPFKKVKIKQFNPFIGIKYTNHAIVDGENKSATYIPLGITYFAKNKMNFSIDIGPSYFQHKSPGYRPTIEEQNRYPYSDYGIWGNFKLGFRF